LRLLLDTHALLWALAADTSLSGEAAAAIADGRSEVFASAASAWEIEIKRALGKLEAPPDLVAAVEATGFEPLAIDMDHAVEAGRLPLHHSDPFDRLLVAQARLERLTLVTSDPQVARYEVQTLPAS